MGPAVSATADRPGRPPGFCIGAGLDRKRQHLPAAITFLQQRALDRTEALSVSEHAEADQLFPRRPKDELKFAGRCILPERGSRPASEYR